MKNAAPLSDHLLLTREEAAELLSMSFSKVKAMIKSGELRPIRCGGSVRITMDELKAWIEMKKLERDLCSENLSNEFGSMQGNGDSEEKRSA